MFFKIDKQQQQQKNQRKGPVLESLFNKFEGLKVNTGVFLCIE